MKRERRRGRADASGRRMPSRRLVLAGGAALLASGGLRAPAVRAEGPVRLGLTPVFLSSDLKLLALLEAHLERRLDAPVDLVTRRSYQEITALLLSGNLEAAWICGYPYVKNQDRIELLAVPLWRGRPLYQAYLIVGQEIAAEGIDDLRDQVHAFSDPDSNSGFLVTQALLAEKGETPSSFFRKTFFTYGHPNVVRAVAAGLAQSGSVDGYVWEVMKEFEPDRTGATRIIRRSEWLGFPPIVCPRHLRKTDLARRIADAFLTMGDDAQGRELLEVMRLDGFAAGERSLFDGIAAKYETVRQLG